MYEITIVPDDSDVLIEQLGTKDKFWYSGEEKLFKQGRSGTGEDWAEKVACELCKILNIPCAEYYFSRYKDKIGTTSVTIVPKGGMLVLGNVLLEKIYDDYVSSKKYGQSKYTVRKVAALLFRTNAIPPRTYNKVENIDTAIGVFSGYLLFDMLISNQDRHHENWGLVGQKSQVYLAETFDHASSLGRNESDETRKRIMTAPKNRGDLNSYVCKAKSAFFNIEGRRMTTEEAVKEVFRYCPDDVHGWIRQFKKITSQDLDTIFNNIPPEIITHTAIEFAKNIILTNQNRIMKLEDNLL